jgi:tetratricopeptide (TPR) repeat protein
MDWSRMIRRIGVVVALAVVAGVVPAFSQTAGITGKVTLQDGSPCVKCEILIERQEVKGTYKVKTDKHGKYIYIGLPLGTYKVTLFSPQGQQLFYFNNKHLGMGDPTEVDFDMPKEVASAKERVMANPEMRQKLEQEDKEQKEFAGLRQLYNEGTELMNDKKYPEAADKFEQALPLAKGKNRLAVLEQIADAYGKANMKDKAIAAYQQAIAAEPTKAGLYNNLGNVYAESGDLDKAKEQFQKAAEIDPASASQYYFNMGAVLYNTGKMDDSAKAFQKAIDIDPKYANAYFWLGQALLGKATTGEGGKVQAAPGTKEAFDTYLKLDPNGPNAATAKALLQTIEGSIETQFSKKKKH